MRISILSAGVFFLAVFFAASAQAGYPDGYSQDFIDAVNWSIGTGAPNYTPHADGMVDNLKTLTHDTQGLIWNPDDPTRVLLSTFANYDGYQKGYTDGGRSITLWLAPAPDLYNFLRDNNISGTDAALRTKQLLGMPADHTGDRVVEVYASVDGLRRAMKNPDVTNPNSSITYPADVDVNYPGFRTWFEGNVHSNFTASTPYPYTQLGYTYDWGNPDSKVGLSEFILPLPTETKFMLDFYAVYSIGSYAYFDRQTGDFNITGDCDTVWAGDTFQPFNGGDAVVISSGATVYSGILISSGGYTVTNHGTVLGPGKNLDKTYRASVIMFQADGTLINTGTIDGLIGVEATAGAMVINNSGLIRGPQCAIRTGISADQITNSGIIDGNIETGGGGDTVNLQGGTVNGNIIDGIVTITATTTTITGGGTGSFLVNANAGQTAVVNGDVRNFASMTIHSGTAKINGQMFGDVTVENAGTLGGNAIIKSGNLINQGTVAPGNSIGIITVEGNYTQQSGATLQVELSKPMDGLMMCDQINASGNATLASGSIIEVVNAGGNHAAFRNNDGFYVITAGGTMTNQGAQITSHSDFLSFTSWISGKKFAVGVSKSATFASVAPEGNSKNLAVALDSDGDTAIDNFANLVDELLFMNSTEFNLAAPGLTPGVYHAVGASSRRTTQYLTESMSEYLQSRRHRGYTQGSPIQPAATTSSPLMGNQFSDESYDIGYMPMSRMLEEAETPAVVRNQQPDNQRQVFARPFGIFFDEQSNGDHVGFHAGSGGVQVALDRVATDDFLYGWGIAYAKTSIKFAEEKGSGDISNIRVGPYISRCVDQWFYDCSATYGYHDDNITRNVAVGAIGGTPNGKYNSHDLSLFMAAGRDGKIGNFDFTPLASLQGIYYHQCAFTESEGNGADLALSNNDSYSLRSKIGAELYRVWCIRSRRLVPNFSLGWAHEYLGADSIRARFAGGTTIFDTDPAGIFRDSMYFGAGLAFLPTEHTSLFLRYNGELASVGQFNAVNLGLAWEY